MMMTALFLLFACDDTELGSVRSPTTAQPLPSHADDTGVFADDEGALPITLIEDPDEATEPGAPAGQDPQCRGDGEGVADVGEGGLHGFTAFEEDTEVLITRGPTGAWGIVLELLTEGVATGFVDVVLNLEAPNGNTTFLGSLSLQCPEPGPGWTSFHVPFPNEVQNAVGSGAWDGDRVHVSLTLIDADIETTHQELDLVVVGP